MVCVLCGKKGTLHHIRKHPRDDVPENFVGLCGDGVTGHHGKIEAQDEVTRRELGAYLLEHRFDTIFWLQEQMGEEAAREWLHQRYFMVI